MAFGTPAVVIRKGGYLETILEGETGMFFDRAEPTDIAAAVHHADGENWMPGRLRNHADRFSEVAFAATVSQLATSLRNE
jgi:glycosyltransferase involved in cell wall biosynthesis